MRQLEKYELTGKDLEFYNKFQEIIKDGDGVSYFGWMEALTSLAYRIQKSVCVPSLKSEEGYEDICNIIDDVETDLVEVCRIVSAGVKEELAEILGDGAKE